MRVHALHAPKREPSSGAPWTLPEVRIMRRYDGMCARCLVIALKAEGYERSVRAVQEARRRYR